MGTSAKAPARQEAIQIILKINTLKIPQMVRGVAVFFHSLYSCRVEAMENTGIVHA